MPDAGAALPLYALWAPEVGLLALLLVGAAGLLAASSPLWPRHWDAAALLPALSRVQLLGGLIAFAAMQVSLLQDDFSVAFVQGNSHAALPVFYKVAALWGAHEGSLLLWILMLTLWGQWLPKTGIGVQGPLPAHSLFGAVVAAFVAFTALTSNPFERLLPLPPEAGADLNPLLQHPAMAVHPPLLYAGYTGTALCFVLACAALAEGRFERTEMQWLYSRTLKPWGFLTAGIALGSWWAYRELGWGGWWFWDPVENLSILPWFAAAALAHALRSALTGRGRDLRWCLVLAVLGFPLAVLGAFLVRSGLLVSVHSFSADPSRGLFLLILLALLTVPALLLLRRLPQSRTEPRAFSSREAMLLLSITLLLLATVTVLLGTLYPLLHEILTGERATLGAVYFERVLTPPAVLAVVGMALAPWSRWQRPLQVPPLALGAVGALALIPLLGVLLWDVLWWQGVLGALLVAATALLLLPKAPLPGIEARPVRLRMLLGHLGALLAAAGILLQGVFGEQHEVLIAPGEQLETQVGTLHFEGIETLEAANYRAESARFRLALGGDERLLHPQKRFYFPRQQVLTETAIAPIGLGDFYLALGRTDEQGGWSLRVHYKPFISLLWLGCTLLVAVLLWPGRPFSGGGAQS